MMTLRDKVGACIVNKNKKIVAIGHNDLPSECVGLQLADFKFEWDKRGVGDKKVKWPDSKYPYVCHASINAILNKNAESLDECTLYTTLFPGHEDVKLILQSHIKKVVYYEKRKQKLTKLAEENLNKAEVVNFQYPKCSNLWPDDSDLNVSKINYRSDIKVFPKKKGPEVNTKGNTDKDRDFFMALALLTAERSKDPHRQVGACIVNEGGKIVGIGYNGMPYGISDSEESWGNYEEQTDIRNVKYHNVVHAEANAIMHKTCIELKGCTMYVTLFPCNECAKLIIQSGIEKIYFLDGEPKTPGAEQSNGKEDRYYMVSSRRLLEMAGYTIFPDCTTLHNRSRFCQKYVPSKEIDVKFPVEEQETKSKSKRNLLKPLLEDSEPKRPKIEKKEEADK